MTPRKANSAMCPGIRACIVGLALQTGLAFFSPGASANSCNSPDDARSPQKLAFLVGINDYQHMDGLKGAVNDVDNMRRLLVDSYCFPDDEEHIRILTNREATREQILKGLDEHLIGTLNTDPENSKATCWRWWPSVCGAPSWARRRSGCCRWPSR